MNISTSSPELKRAERADRIIRSTLVARGLPLPPATPLLTHDERLGGVLFWRMNTERMGKLEPYTGEAVTHHISTNLRGWPVVVCNHVGLAYGVVLGHQRPELLPAHAPFPAIEWERMLIGVDANGAGIGLSVKELGHMLVVGATGFGKSTFLRLLVYQAIAHSFQLALADLDGRTFPMLAHHPALLRPLATTTAEVVELLSRLTELLAERQRLFAAAPNFPESLDEYNAQVTASQKLPRVLVMLDEISATIMALGGPRSSFARELATLGWRARKFGMTLVLAGQDFRKEVVGAIKESLVGPTIAFRLATAEAARNVGLPAAVKITQPGRAITDRWGMVQTYHLPKSTLITAPATPTLTQAERHMAWHLLTHFHGRMNYETLGELGIAEREARRLCAEWDARGWTAKDPNRANGRYLQPALLALLDVLSPNRPGRPSHPTPENARPFVIGSASEPALNAELDVQAGQALGR